MHDGQTLLFPFRRWPQQATINCLYAAFLNALVLLSSWPLCMSPVFRIHSSGTSGSRHNLTKRDESVIHFFNLQHLFSISCGIGRHFPQSHQSGTVPGGSCTGFEISVLLELWAGISSSACSDNCPNSPRSSLSPKSSSMIGSESM